MGTPLICLLITTLVAGLESQFSQPEGFLSNSDSPISFTDGLSQMLWGSDLQGDNISNSVGMSLDQIFDIRKYHDQGIDGTGVKIAVFDSGIGAEYQDEEMRMDMNIMEIIDFTQGTVSENEEPLGLQAVDYNGHGTFVAGVISSTNERCPGIATGAEVHILKLFTDDEITYSSWFLDAFNYVLDNDIDIVNLSTASKDSMDTPFRDKIAELTAAGVIVISAIGNDGPTQGSAENPGDLQNVIGVGSLSSSLDDVAFFSSRGMTKVNLLDGIGIFNPDLLMPGEEIFGLSLIKGQCDLKQGTSFSVPMLSAAVALTLSAIDQQHGMAYRKSIQNTALVRQAIIKSSSRLKSRSIVEQGSGRFNLDAFYDQMMNTDRLPVTQVYPYAMNFTNGSDYFLPFNRQRIYSSMMPLGMNFTIINRESAHFKIKSNPTIKINNQQIKENKCLQLDFSYEDVLSPFFGQIHVDLVAPDTPECRELEASQLEVLVKLTIENLDAFRIGHIQSEILTQFKIIVDFIKTPDRSRRLLYDQFHSLNYPTNGFIWSDNLDQQNEEDPYEWLGDHLFTNMQGLYQRLSKQGFFIETLNQPMTCFDANNYKALLLIDPEDYLSKGEIDKLQIDIESKDLSLIVVADWYNKEKINRKKYYNIVTFEEWQPFMGGANVPTLNSLLRPYHIALGQGVYAGTFYIEGKPIDIVSGSEIIEFPKDGYLIAPELNVQEPAPVRVQDDEISTGRFGKKNVPTIGVLNGLPDYPNSGSIIVMTDSDCVSGSRQVRSCLHLIEHFVGIATQPKLLGGPLEEQEHRANSTASEDMMDANNSVLSLESYISSVSSEKAPWSVLIQENYRLPQDYHKRLERPLFGNFESSVLDWIETTEGHLIKGSYLNSMEAWDMETQSMTCRAPQISQFDIAIDLENHKSYNHNESEENLATWTESPVNTKVIGGNMEWQSFFPVIGLAAGAKFSGLWKFVLSFFGVFSLGIYLVKRFCIRQKKRSNAAQVRAARRAIHQTIQYESSNSDGFSGHSDYEIDSSSDSASTGDLAISFEENDLNTSSVTAEYH